MLAGAGQPYLAVEGRKTLPIFTLRREAHSPEPTTRVSSATLA